MPDPVNTLRFDVAIDGLDLGSFTAMDGLGAEYEVESYSEGGENGYIHQLPGRLKYSNIKVSRPVDLESKALYIWFGMLAKGVGVPRGTATVIAFNDNSEPLAEWTFVGVWPVRYTGPSFSTDNGKVAIETFEFAHTGLIF